MLYQLQLEQDRCVRRKKVNVAQMLYMKMKSMQYLRCLMHADSTARMYTFDVFANIFGQVTIPNKWHTIAFGYSLCSIFLTLQCCTPAELKSCDPQPVHTVLQNNPIIPNVWRDVDMHIHAVHAFILVCLFPMSRHTHLYI